jgi:hypothetical protein
MLADSDTPEVQIHQIGPSRELVVGPRASYRAPEIPLRAPRIRSGQGGQGPAEDDRVQKLHAQDVALGRTGKAPSRGAGRYGLKYPMR